MTGTWQQNCVWPICWKLSLPAVIDNGLLWSSWKHLLQTTAQPLLSQSQTLYTRTTIIILKTVSCSFCETSNPHWTSLSVFLTTVITLTDSLSLSIVVTRPNHVRLLCWITVQQSMMWSQPAVSYYVIPNFFEILHILLSQFISHWPNSLFFSANIQLSPSNNESTNVFCSTVLICSFIKSVVSRKPVTLTVALDTVNKQSLKHTTHCPGFRAVSHTIYSQTL